MKDPDVQAVCDRLGAAVAASGLSMRQFARALGTSASRFSTYRTGKVDPSAAFLLRAERIAQALLQARRDGMPTIIDAARAIHAAAARGEVDWAFTLELEARDRLHDILRHQPSLAASWEAQPSGTHEDRWNRLLAALVSHEFTQAGLPAPTWTEPRAEAEEWILDTPRLTQQQIKASAPAWLADRNIFIAHKDLVTL